jgi:hypothetical protein
MKTFLMVLYLFCAMAMLPILAVILQSNVREENWYGRVYVGDSGGLSSTTVSDYHKLI